MAQGFVMALRTRLFQVIGIPIRGGQYLSIIYLKIAALNTKIVKNYLRTHPSKHSH